MNDYERLKKTQKEIGSALTCSFKKNGEILIYITADADNEQVMSSLITLSVEISEHRGINK